jgi:signal transduction histidine kinase
MTIELPPHILLLDDDEGLLHLARKTLERSGYRVTGTTSTDDAYRESKKDRPSLLIVDYDLKSAETGLDFFRATRQQGMLIPAIMVTGFADESRVIEALRAGVADVLPKTGDYLEYLPEAVERVLLQGRLQKRLAEAEMLRDREQEREFLLASERTARSEAERAVRVKDEFVATLSHELRTPLNAILGWAQFLLRDRSDPEKLRKGLEVIDRNAKLQAQMVDDLLDMSRIMSGKLRLEVQRIDLAEIIDNVLTSIYPSADAKEIRLSKMLESAGIIQGDPARLQQIMWNLLTNAIKFTPKQGKVKVTLRKIDSEVEIAVIDNGQGIKNEFLAHVFDRFRQEDASTSRQFSGLGLGLSLAKQLIEMHGGFIEAKSEGEGKGASFFVRLPLAAVQIEDYSFNHHDVYTDREPVLNGLQILIVEDEPDARDLVQRILEERGACVTVAGCAAEALASFIKRKPDVIISDIGMPGQDGYEFIRKLRAIEEIGGKRTPAAALTALARSEDRRRALLSGFQTHIAKPVDPLELLAVVASLAGRTGVKKHEK